MKKLLLAVTAIVALSMLAPGAGIAEPTHPNEVGLYLDPLGPDGTGATGTYVIGAPVTVYLVLTRPTDTATGTPYDTINFFECQLNFFPTGNLFKLWDTFPPQAINIGDNTDLFQGYLEYIVGLGTDYPVTNESVVLIEFGFLHAAPGVIEVTLGPVSVPLIPGQMAFGDWLKDSPYANVMFPISGSHDAPVFLFEGEAVAVETDTFGTVKALYR